jgi:hypothetical protein
MLSGMAWMTTFPSVFSNAQCSSRMLSPLSLIAAGLSLSRRPTCVHAHFEVTHLLMISGSYHSPPWFDLIYEALAHERV